MRDRELKVWFEQLNEAASSTFWGYLGCKLEDITQHKAVISLDIQPHHLNLLGIVHGGVYASLLDNVMGLTAMAARPEQQVVTTNLNIHYMATIREGKAIATAELVHQSRKIITIQGTVADEHGAVCAMGTGSFRVIT